MQLRHIRPGTVDWNDATVDQSDQSDQSGTDELAELLKRRPSEAPAMVPRDNQIAAGRPSKN